MDSLVSWDSFWCAGKAREKACLQTLTVLHVPGDPLQKDDLDSKLDILRYISIITIFLPLLAAKLHDERSVSLHWHANGVQQYGMILAYAGLAAVSLVCSIFIIYKHLQLAH